MYAFSKEFEHFSSNYLAVLFRLHRRQDIGGTLHGCISALYCAYICIYVSNDKGEFYLSLAQDYF